MNVHRPEPFEHWEKWLARFILVVAHANPGIESSGSRSRGMSERNNVPQKAVMAAPSTADSNMIGMSVMNESSGRPPTFSG
jgi:hypothetical protein